MGNEELKDQIRKLVEDPGFEAALKELNEEQERDIARTRPEFGMELIESLEIFEESFEFHKGQLIEWKPRMKNRRYPMYSEPLVVIEILADPLSTDSEASSPYFGEKLDLVAGVIGPDDEFLVFHFPSERFRPYEPAAPTEANRSASGEV